ncbi:MAG: ATP-binding cassette domain-containing protein [Planctomycetales bacterium]|nr:ATP-binding cassette domain-containing protein [Planctomycetales bacterium]
MQLFELQSVGYEQDGVRILHKADWSVRAGEHWAVLGPNGSGKTSLLRVATGYQWPTSGRVLRGGKPLVNLAEMRRTIGWVGEELISRVPHEQSALQIAASGAVGQLGLRLIGQVDPTREDFQRSEELLVQAGCGEVIHSPFRVLSQGERQKVLVARARMASPALLVLDEPCAGMDPGAREGFLAWLQELLTASDTPTVLFVTHHVEEILPGMEKTAVVQAGRIAAAGATADVVTPAMLAELYGVEVEQLVRAKGRLWPVW